MPATSTYPGVYFEEIPSGVRWRREMQNILKTKLAK
jgi:hypothetical protein